jgi:hypothetical protein
MRSPTTTSTDRELGARARSARRRAIGRVVDRSARGGGRLALAVALAATAAVVRGSAGVLLAIFAVMLAADAAIPLPGARWSQADDRFGRLALERRLAARLRRLRGLAPERLELFDDRDGWAAVAPRRAVGIQSIPIDSITGTAEDSKARLFDRRFRPDRSARERWNRLWMAHAHGSALPPISVYRIGAWHIVRDGHHRVSVARDLGWSTIDADVVELLRPPAGR